MTTRDKDAPMRFRCARRVPEDEFATFDTPEEFADALEMHPQDRARFVMLFRARSDDDEVH
jgi:hypothetical protein